MMSYIEIVEKGKKTMKELGIYDTYFGGAAETGATLRRNREFLETICFKLNLIDSVTADTQTEIFGNKFQTPIFAAPMSTSPELVKITDSPLAAVATGVKAAKSLMFVGISSQEQFEAVVKTGVPAVKIVKPFRNHELVVREIESAERVGAKAVGMDIDFIAGGKNRDILMRADIMGPQSSKDLKDFASITKLPFVLKGILGRRDAEKAVDVGAECLVVSNHGGSVLDYSIHALEALPEVKASLEDGMKVLVDGGFRRGTDVMKALALGADGVLVGRALLLGLAAGLSDGVRDIIVAMTSELQRVMTLTGCANLQSVNASVLEKSNFIPRFQVEE